MHFRVLTYNIHKGIGGIDRRYRLERVIAVIRACEADIALLQEVDDGVPRSRLERQVDVIGDALEMPGRAFQANVSLRRGGYGNAIVSRFPLANVADLDLSVPLKKRRRALLADCVVDARDGRRVLLVTCHLGLAAFERRIQVQRLLAHVLLRPGALSLTHIIGGDFNDSWRAIGKRFMAPAGYAATHSRAATFPAMLPMRRLDHIYYRGDLHARHSFVGHSRLARQASDHLPLIADFELPPRDTDSNEP